jgi:prevent-host-death family protein
LSAQDQPYAKRKLAMREMSVRGANQNFSEVIAAAEAGETIAKNGRPVAKISRQPADQTEGPERRAAYQGPARSQAGHARCRPRNCTGAGSRRTVRLVPAAFPQALRQVDIYRSTPKIARKTDSTIAVAAELARERKFRSGTARSAS